MTYPDELQQYEDRMARRNRVINRIIVLCFVLIVLTLLAFITAIGWYVNAQHREPTVHKTESGSNKVEHTSRRRMYDGR